MRGIPWTIATFAGHRAIPMLTTLVLARLLAPADFGLIAMAGVAVGVLSILVDMGMQNTLILRRDLSRRDSGTVFTLMFVMSVAVALTGVALSPLVALAYGEPEVAGIVAALSGVVVLGSITSFYDAILQRELEFKRRFVALIANSAIYAATALALALTGAGVWSLVIGQAAGYAASCILLVAVLTPYKVRPRFDRAVARSVLGTGSGFLLQGGLSFVQQNVDYAVVGRVLGARTLGFYSMAFRLGELPTLAISDSVAKVTFSAFSRMRERGEEIANAFLHVLRLVALAACPVGILVSATADPFVHTLLGAQWAPAIGPIAVLGVWAALYPVNNTLNWMMNSIGRPMLLAVVTGALIVPFIAGVVVAAVAAGTVAVSVVVLARTGLSVIASAVLVRTHAGVPLREQWRALRPVVAGCVLAWPVAHAVTRAMADAPPPAALGAAVGAGVLAYLAGVSLTDHGLPRQTLAQLRRLTRRGDVVVAPS